MSQREETEEGVRPPETPQCEQHGSQTEAQSPEQQRPDSPGLSMSVDSSVLTHSILLWDTEMNFMDSLRSSRRLQNFSSSSDKKDVATDDGDLGDFVVPLKPTASTGSSCVSVKSDDSSQGCINAKKRRRSDFSSSSDEEDVATDDGFWDKFQICTESGDSATSNVSFKSDMSKEDTIYFSLKPDFSSSSGGEGVADDGDLVQPSRRQPRTESRDSVISSVSFKSDRSKDNVIDFKESSSQ